MKKMFVEVVVDLMELFVGFFRVNLAFVLAVVIYCVIMEMLGLDVNDTPMIVDFETLWNF